MEENQERMDQEDEVFWKNLFYIIIIIKIMYVSLYFKIHLSL